MTILELIKAQCKVLGVPEKHAERIEKISGITEEKDGNITAAVNSFKENVLPAITEAENASKTAVSDYEKKHNLKDGKAIEVKKEDEPVKVVLPENLDPAIKAMIEAMQQSNKELKDMVSGIVGSQKNAQTLEVVKAKLKGKIDDDFIDDYAGRVKLDSENIDAEIENAVKSFTDTKQKFLNKEVESGNYIPNSGYSGGERSVEDWAKLMNKEDNTSAGVVDLGLNK